MVLLSEVARTKGLAEAKTEKVQKDTTAEQKGDKKAGQMAVSRRRRPF